MGDGNKINIDGEWISISRCGDRRVKRESDVVEDVDKDGGGVMS